MTISTKIITPKTGNITVSHQTKLGVANYDLDELYSPDTGLWKSKVLDMGSPKYSLNETYWFDRSRYQNHGTITGAIWGRRPSGIWALRFDGGDDYVDCGAGATLDITTGDLSVECWIYYDTQVEDSPMPVHKGGHALGTAGYSFEGGTIASGNAYKPLFEISDGGGVAGDKVNSNRASAALNDGKWHHLAGVADRTAATITLFVDGVTTTPVAIPGTVGSITNAAQALSIGGLTTIYNFKGLIGLVRVYTCVLSASEVKQNFLRTQWRYQ